MRDRRSFLKKFAVGFVALAVIVAPAIAEELFGVITKVDVEASKLTVVEKGSDKEVMITTNDETELITPKGANKVNLRALSKIVAKQQDAGKKGVMAKIQHENGVASKIRVGARKKAD